VHRLIAIVLIAATSLALGHAPCCLLHASGCAASSASSVGGAGAGAGNVPGGCCVGDSIGNACCESARGPGDFSGDVPGDVLCPHCGVRHPKQQKPAPSGSGCSAAVLVGVAATASSAGTTIGVAPAPLVALWIPISMECGLSIFSTRALSAPPHAPPKPDTAQSLPLLL